MNLLATTVVQVTDARLRYTGARFLLALSVPFSTVAQAGSSVWTSGGPYGGDVLALAINPTTSSTLYAGTADGGVFKSTDSGATWFAVNAGLTNPIAHVNPVVRALVVDPTTPTTLYAGTYDGVFKSTDSAGTWVQANTGLTYRGVDALILDPTTPTTLYAGTFGGGVFKSTDSGGMWAEVNAGLTNVGLSVYALAIDPSKPHTLYAGTFGGGVFKSTDSGGSWAAINVGLVNLNAPALAIDPSTPATLYAGTHQGVFKSTDAGGTWAPSNAGLKDQGQILYALGIDPSTPSMLYAGTLGGVFKSIDSGATWTAANAGLTDQFAQVFAINPANPATLYAGTSTLYGRGGIFKSADSGGTWAAANTGLARPHVLALAINPANHATLYAGTQDAGVFKSTDSGGAWASTNFGLGDLNVLSLAINPTVPSTLYAGTYRGGVFKSTDSGGTWAGANTGITSPDVWSLAVNPANPATLYAAATSGVFKSTDSGGTWAAVDMGAAYLGVDTLAINPANPATLYAGTYGSGVYKSVDSGSTWAPVNTGLTNMYVSALAINPSNPSTLYAAASTLYAGDGGGIFKSTDSGGTWVAVNAGLTDLNVLALAIDTSDPATLYAGTFNGGVFKSTDSGGTWTAVNAGLPPYLSIRALALDSTGPTTLYAGAALGSGGVWQATPPMVGTAALLPASAHSTGANGAFFTTNVSVANLGTSAASFTLKFLGNNQDGSSGPEHDFNLDPGRSFTFFDVLESVFNQTSNFGAIRITSNSPTLEVVSATSTPGFGGTLGQALSAVSSPDLIPAGSSRSILYVREGDGFRSNLVLANGASVSTNVEVALVSPEGQTLTTKTYSVPPNGMTQINRVVREMGLSGPVTGARLVLSSGTQGAAFTGFASVIDETTNDPTAVLAQAASVSGSAPYVWLLPASAHASGLNGAFYTTNVAVANVGFAPASFTMKFLGHNQDGSGGPERTFDLEFGKSVTYFDVLGSVFDQTSDFGAIRITSNSPTLNIVSVTSTPGFGGTLSQTIPAVFSPDLIPAGSPRSILYIREGDGFRSNLILASNSSSATNVDVTLLLSDGSILATKSYSVPPNGMTQINRIARDMGVSGPITGARLVLSSSSPNAAFTGFASVIDETTNDPTAVEAK